MNQPPAGEVFQFGSFRLDPQQRLLERNGQRLPVLQKSLDLLTVLVRARGQLVDKDALLDAVWAGVAVEENSLAKAVSEIRKVLGDDPRDGRYILTVPGRGYRFVAAVVSDCPVSPPTTVAVLPLTPLSAEEADEHLAIGLSDALIGRLSRFRGVIVRPTGSVLRYAGGHHDPAAAGLELGADHVVAGTVRRSGARVRVSVQLIHAASGSTTWGESFDQATSDIFSIEDDVSERVAQALALELPGDREPRRPTTDSEAYQLHLRGRFFWSKRTVEGCRKAIECFQGAIRRDPLFAGAHTGLADAYMMLALQAALLSGRPPHETMPHAKAAVATALKLDPVSAEAHASLGQIAFFYDWSWIDAERAFRRSIALNPHYVHARHWYALALSFVCRLDHGLEEIRRALAIEPMSLILNVNFGRMLYLAKRYDDAMTQLRTTVEMDPGFAPGRYRLGLLFEALGDYDRALDEFLAAERLSAGGPLATASVAYVHAVAGRPGEARRVLADLCGGPGNRYVSAASIAEVHAGLGDREAMLAWLDRAIDERANALVAIRVNPRYDRYREDRDFARRVSRIGAGP